MSSDLHFLVPESFHKKLVQIDTLVSEKIRFEFLYVHDLGPRSRNDLDLQFSHTFIYSIRCLLLLTFRSLAAIKLRTDLLKNCYFSAIMYIFETSKIKFDERMTSPLKYNCQDTLVCHQPQI